jgi:hypothetical protein
MEKPEATEVAVRVKDFDRLDSVYENLRETLGKHKNKKIPPYMN